MVNFVRLKHVIALLLLVFGAGSVSIGHAQQPAATAQESHLRQHLIFLSTFDGTTTAEIASGDGRLFTAQNRRSLDKATPGLNDPDVSLAEGKGLAGGALEFKKKDRLLTYYNAQGNAGYSDTSWQGAVSFWLKLDPAKDLEPGYCDPIQITDSAYNDAAIWVDFTKDNPRDFRLGVIGDLNSWNPDKLPPDKNPGFEQRLITAKQPPFGRERWTHVLINFSGLNSDQGRTEFYLNGVLQGKLPVKEPFTWDAANAQIMLGLNYIGLMDEIAIFDRPLAESEIQRIYAGKSGIKTVLGVSQ